MRNTFKRRLSASLALILVLTTLSVSFAFGADTSPESAQAKADLLVEGYGATSVQFALIEDGVITASSTSGVYGVESPVVLESSHMYAVGSISKMFTAASVMMLVDEGAVKLDEPVTTYITDFQMADPRYKDITVRMLLNHSSGLMGGSMANAFLLGDNDPYAHDKLLENLKTQTLKADPGAYSVYCNDGFTLAEILVERVSGMTFTQFVEERVSKPLGLTRTKTPQSTFDKAMLSQVYYPTISTALPADTANVIGTGGIYSTAEELCKVSQIFMKDTKGNDLLKKESVAAMAEKEYRKGIWTEGEGLVSYGLGWDCVQLEPFTGYGIQALSKGGDTLLSHGSLVVIPEHNMAAAVLSVGSSSVYNQMVAETLLLDALRAKGIIPAEGTDGITTTGAAITAAEPSEDEAKTEETDAISLADDTELDADEETGRPSFPTEEIPESLLSREGFYGYYGGLMKVSFRDGDTLSITVPDVEGYEEVYFHVGEGTFVDLSGEVKVSFVTEKNGKIYMEVEGPSYLPGLGELYGTQYNSVKLEANPLSASVKAAWDAREGKNYYAVNEKYTSQYHMVQGWWLTMKQYQEFPGYVSSHRIIDENTMRGDAQIPGMNGRDLSQVTFHVENGVEYARDKSNLYISEDAVADIYKGSYSVLTIKEDGYGIWLKAGHMAGKTMTVSVPGNASFAVYDKQGQCLNFSWASGMDTVKLPENAMVLFMGEPGSQFEIFMK